MDCPLLFITAWITKKRMSFLIFTIVYSQDREKKKKNHIFYEFNFYPSWKHPFGKNGSVHDDKWRQKIVRSINIYFIKILQTVYNFVLKYKEHRLNVEFDNIRDLNTAMVFETSRIASGLTLLSVAQRRGIFECAVFKRRDEALLSYLWTVLGKLTNFWSWVLQ